MCVPSFNFIAFVAPQKSVMKTFHLWQSGKPKGIKIQELWARGPDWYT